MNRDPWWMRHPIATAALILGALLCTIAPFMQLLIPHDDGGRRTVSFDRDAPCYACGDPAPMTITLNDGTVWNITRPGPVQDVLATYCPTACTYRIGDHDGHVR